MRRQEGITLVELLVAMAVMGIVLWAVLGIWVGANRSSRVTFDSVEAQSAARVAMKRLESDARSASRGSIVIVPGRNEDGTPADCTVVDCSVLMDDIAFETLLPNDTTFTNVHYYVDDAANLVREVGGNPVRVASGVTDFTIPQATGESAVVEMTVEVGGRESVIRTNVFFRNP